MVKKYCLVDCGARGIGAYAQPIVSDFDDCAQLAGVYDINHKRAELMSEFTVANIPVFDNFDDMISVCKPDANGHYSSLNVKLYGLNGEPVNEFKIDTSTGGAHGGGDNLMRSNIFRGYSDDPLGQMEATRAGAMSIGIGIAANISMVEDRAVYLSEFLGDFYDNM